MSFKVKHITSFSSIPKQPIFDENLSFGAKGLYCYLYLSEQINLQNLKEKEHLFLLELQDFGYIEFKSGGICLNERGENENI